MKLFNLDKFPTSEDDMNSYKCLISKDFTEHMTTESR